MTKIRGFLFTASIMLATAFTFSCSGGDGGGDPSLSSVVVVPGRTVDYGNETYQTVVIGTQTWFARNLNYAAEGSECYNNSDSYCESYGRLYDWETARTICPSGWHLPNNVEWNVMTTYIGGVTTGGKKLKAPSGWNDFNGVPGNGTDDYEFFALPGGSYSDGSFKDVRSSGHWWSASEDEEISSYAYRWIMSNSRENVSWVRHRKSSLFSVRCVKD